LTFDFLASHSIYIWRHNKPPLLRTQRLSLPETPVVAFKRIKLQQIAGTV
jgi:hypothetical protein